MSCFQEGTNYARPSKGRRALKAASRLVSGGHKRSGQGTSPRTDKGDGDLGVCSEGTRLQSCPTSPSLQRRRFSDDRSVANHVKRLRSLERRLTQPRPCLSSDNSIEAVSLKLEYVNCLSDSGRFREALAVLVDILEEQERNQRQLESLKEERDAKSKDDCHHRGGSGGSSGGFMAPPPPPPRPVSSFCSAPVFNVRQLMAEDEAAKTEGNRFLNASDFQRLVKTIAQTTIDVANKTPGFLRHINSTKDESEKRNNARKHRMSGGGNGSHVGKENLFVDYKVSPGQITPCPWSCPSCAGVLIDPISLQCGHTYCRACLVRLAKAAKLTKRAHCLKCGALWFPIPQPKEPKVTGLDEGANDGQVNQGQNQEENGGGDGNGGDGGQVGEGEDNGGEGGNETETPFVMPRTPLEALDLLKVNVVVNKLCSKYWNDDIEAIQHRQHGNDYFRRGKSSDAVKAYSKAVGLVADEHFTLGNRANAWQKMGDYERALEDAQEAVRVRPDWAKGYFRKGSALQMLNRHEEAFCAFFECLSIETATGNDIKDAARESAKELFIVLKQHVSKERQDDDDETARKQAEESSNNRSADNGEDVSCSKMQKSTTSKTTTTTMPMPSGSKESSPETSSTDSGLGTPSSSSSSSDSATQSNTSLSSDFQSKCNSSSLKRPAAKTATTNNVVNAPQPILSLVDYAALLYEKRANLELVNKPIEEWIMRGLLTYRRPYRNIPDNQVDKDDYECSLCLKLLWKPVTTSCGHTYCKVCLEQALDHNAQCPQCRSTIVKNLLADRRELTPNEFIESSMRRLMPQLYNERKRVHYCEMRESGENADGGTLGQGKDDANIIPVFVCTTSAPNIPCPLHIFEPRYRLMIRRAMESGTREFGMSCQVDETNPFADYGTMLEIRDVQYFSDGRSIIDTVGGRRFQVLDRGTRDGYNTAKVEFIQDEMPKEDELTALQNLHDATFWRAGRWFAQMGTDIKAGILMHYGNLPEPENDYWKLPNGPSWVWWLLMIMPLEAKVRFQVLSTTSLRQRLEVVAAILRFISQSRRSQIQHQFN